MYNRFAFLPMRAANDLLGDREALRKQLDEDGYLLLRQVLDREAVKDLRGEIVDVLARRGWVEKPGIPISTRRLIAPLREDDDEYLQGYDDVQRLQIFHEFAHDPVLTEIMSDVLGDTAFPHPLKIARIAFPDHFEASTPPHQDFPNNQGTASLTAAWLPVTPMVGAMGGLAVLRGSHRWGPLPLARHLGAGNRCAVVPDDMAEACRWVTTDYDLGDVLLFSSLTVHAALDNAHDMDLRLSVDYRYQLEGEPLTDLVLHPHFQRLTWDEIYAGWSSPGHRRYWEDLDFEVVPFEEFELVNHDGSTNIAQEQMREIVRYGWQVEARSARRLAAIESERAAAAEAEPAQGSAGS
jgi:ectoine hydroxylase-related dioxygenase (phytanoyl-CoA dioxygenase family)